MAHAPALVSVHIPDHIIPDACGLPSPPLPGGLVKISCRLWWLTLVAAFCVSQLPGQADSTAPNIPDLSGPWRLTAPTITGILPAIFSQDKHVVRVEIISRVRCAGAMIDLNIALLGTVNGRVVELPNATRRVEGDLGNPCVESLEYVGIGFHYKGELSTDGKKIVGPYDKSGQSTHVWTFSR